MQGLGLEHCLGPNELVLLECFLDRNLIVNLSNHLAQCCQYQVFLNPSLISEVFEVLIAYHQLLMCCYLHGDGFLISHLSYESGRLLVEILHGHPNVNLLVWSSLL